MSDDGQYKVQLVLIKPALVKRAQKQPAHWNEVHCGPWLSQQERLALTPYWATMAGDYALLLGPLSAEVGAACRATELVSVHPGENARVRAELNALPFAKRSVDIAVLSHVLEYAKDPHQVLREADRCLAFDGYLVVTAYNPTALATFTGAWPKYLNKAPWNGRYFTRRRVEDWLALLNYEVLAHGYIGNRALAWSTDSSHAGDHENQSASPCQLSKQRTAPSDNPLCRLVPWLRCGYFLVARKRVFPLTPSPGFLRFTASVRQPRTAQARSHKTIDKC